jgi:hypothetical protein
MVADVVAATPRVVTAKLADVAFAATVTVAGTWAAAVLPLVSATTAPAGGAAPVRVTVAVEEDPPSKLVGLRVNKVRVAGLTVSTAVFVTELYVAETVTGVGALTPRVVTVNVAVVAFAATVTVEGTWAAAALLLVRETTAPPVGARPSRVTVAVDDDPPSSPVGFSEAVIKFAGFTVSPAVAVPAFAVAEMVANAIDRTGLVATEKVAEEAPEGTVTLTGTVATVVLLLDSPTTVPPAGDGLLSVTVAVDDVPPITEVGFSASDDGVGGKTLTLRIVDCAVLL